MVLPGKNRFMENRPRVTITFGLIIANCWSNHGLQASISSGNGSRLPGGRLLMMLVIKTSSLLSPIDSINWVRNFPAAPQKGRPVLSSLNPGASPINMISASGLPSPGTAQVRVPAKPHRWQLWISRAILSSRLDWSVMVNIFLKALAFRHISTRTNLSQSAE